MGTLMSASMGGGRGRGTSSPADNASVCTCTCTRARARNDGYRSGSLPYASGSIYDDGREIGNVDDDAIVCGDGVGFDDGDACEVQNIKLETFYDGYPSPVDPYSCRQRVVQTPHRSSI